jgi:medium-chain acyl-[acyl-carrier-protein] hydrolase
MAESSWIAHRVKDPHARLRLFCFHHAGGAAHVFRTWGEWLPKAVEVCPIQLPGRGTRMGEPLIRKIEPLVEAAVAGIERDLSAPFAFFGHSLGALLAFEIARELRRRALPDPAHLFVAARIGPSVPLKTSPIYHLVDREFVEALRQRYNAIPDEIAREPELLAIMLPILRADLTIHESYQHRAEPPLSCPISAYGGTRDHAVLKRDLEAWAAETTRAFKLHVMEGDHFFIHAKSPTFRSTLSEELTAVLRGLGAAPAT